MSTKLLTYGPLHQELDDLIAVMEQQTAEARKDLALAEEKLVAFKAGRDVLKAQTDPKTYPHLRQPAAEPMGGIEYVDGIRKMSRGGAL